MSHHRERTEKNCLNCGTTVAGRFCQHCGQENIPSHMPFFALVKHFVYDIFHFDGKFFDTLRYLFLKPGFVARQYVDGKRVSYLDPFRMYLFTSALFFLIFFSISESAIVLAGKDETEALGKAERFELASGIYNDSVLAANDSSSKQLDLLLDPSVDLERLFRNPNADDSAFRIGRKDSAFWVIARSAGALDTVTLLGNDDSWMGKQLEQRWTRYKRQFDNDGSAMFRDFGNRFLHKFPYLLFVSLPLFALMLQLLYGRKKGLVYSDHATFTLYYYIFSFILLLCYFAFSKLGEVTDVGFFRSLAGWLIPLWAVYLLLSMRRFYEQGWRKTLAKFFLLNVLAIFMMAVLAFTFIMFSIFQI